MATVDRRGVVVDATDSPIAGDPNPGLAIKVACLCATTGANIALAGVQAIDGVTVGNNDERVLVKDQTDPTQNGIYNASSGNWTRATDADGNTDLANGLQVMVQSGTINGGYKIYVCTSPNPISIGSSAITWQVLNYPQSALEFVIDGGGVPITAGFKGAIEVPFACHITRSTLMADVVGSVQLDIRKTTYANPTGGASIVAADPPALVNQQSSQDSTLTGWTIALNAGDVLGFWVLGAPTPTVDVLTSSLVVTRN